MCNMHFPIFVQNLTSVVEEVLYQLFVHPVSTETLKYKYSILNLS